MISVASARYEFEGFTENVVELYYPDKLFHCEFMRRWMSRNPHTLEYKQNCE